MSERLRYTRRAFPSYRFIPGENPHPTESPQGHSYGKSEPEIKSFDPAQWRENEQYLYGVDLYNHYYWWESHEVLEGLWRTAVRGDVSRDFLQGLIKISGAFIKWHLKKQQGVELLYRGAMEHLLNVKKIHKNYMGINVEEHVGRLHCHFLGVTHPSHEWPDPVDHYPAIILDM